jgi:hypothetical protein
MYFYLGPTAIKNRADPPSTRTGVSSIPSTDTDNAMVSEVTAGGEVVAGEDVAMTDKTVRFDEAVLVQPIERYVYFRY